MEVFWVGPDGSVHDAFFYEGGQWQQFVLAPHIMSTHSRIAAVSRIRDSMEIWWVGADGSVHDAYWYPQTANPSITLRAVQNQGRFIEVTGVQFTPNQSVKLAYDITSGGGPTTHQTGEVTLTSNDAGGFIYSIRVNLGGDISGSNVQATDVASGKPASASI